MKLNEAQAVSISLRDCSWRASVRDYIAAFAVCMVFLWAYARVIKFLWGDVE